MNELFFRIALLTLIAAFVAHRGYYTQKYRESENNTLKKRQEDWLSKLAGMLGLAGLIAILVYTFNPGWLGWASLQLPLWLRWAGLGIALIGFTLLQWAQNSLGRNWSDTPRMQKTQALITDGPYRFIRHPIYTAFLLILGSTSLISSNGLIGICWIGMTTLEVISRMNYEEALMLEHFGEPYRAYMQRTGRLLPLIRLRKSFP